MAEANQGSTESVAVEKTAEDGERKDSKRRDIKGGLPYSVSPGVFKKALEGIIISERPDKFSGHFLSTILKLTGGSAKAVPPLLKKMNFLSSDGSPTDLYSKFKSDSARSSAALEGLRSAFSEMFKRNEFIHKADESKVIDLIVEITGLRKADRIVGYTYQSFEAIRSFIDKNQPSIEAGIFPEREAPDLISPRGVQEFSKPNNIGIAYNINIILPETENVAVFNAIFRSLKANLLS